MKTYLFNDCEYFNRPIYATSWRDAIYQCRDIFRIKGRLRIIAKVGNCREYALDDSAGYKFRLFEA